MLIMYPRMTVTLLGQMKCAAIDKLALIELLQNNTIIIISIMLP